ncbi:MAG: glutamate--tRNA ligase family protein, partial [Alphaproteobacteria bacterium]|nr:glutamate--tRNA ligase family protein [Alphaproteobacteria bacterium]
TWLGLQWDATYRQSERLTHYQQAADHLRTAGRLYPCYETREELELMRKLAEQRGAPPIYDRGALKLTRQQINELEASGRRPHYRFLLEGRDMAWQDGGKGAVHFAAGIVSDPILIKEDGTPLYTLSSVVDDGLLAISLILRGDDHLTNSAAQIQLFQALGYDVPTLVHLPRMVDGAGGKLSKRLGAKSLRDYRAAGMHPRTLLSYLAHLGLSTAASGKETLTNLIEHVDLTAFGKSESKFFEADLFGLNERLLQHLSWHDAQSFYGATALKDFTAASWEKIGNSITHPDLLPVFAGILNHGFIARHVFTTAEQTVLSAAHQTMPVDLNPQDKTNMTAWLDEIKKITSKGGKELFHPLRLALTDRLDGPTIPDLITLLG